MELSWQRRALQEAFALLEKEGNLRLAEDLKRIGEIGGLDDTENFRDRRLHYLFETYEHTEETHEIASLLKEICRCLDLKNMSFFVMREPRGRILNERAFTTCSNEWIDRYVRNRFWSVDPVVTNFRETGNDLYWQNCALPGGGYNPVLLNFLRSAEDSGVGAHGFARYIDCGRNGAYVITVTSDRIEDEFYETVTEISDDLTVIATLFIAYLLDGHDDIDARVNRLSDEETEIMRLLAAGAEERVIMESTGLGNEIFGIISGVKRKLGVETVPQAIFAIAGSDGFRFFPPLPYEIHVCHSGDEFKA